MTIRTQNLVTRNLITIPTGSRLSDAHQLMKEKKIRHLPVVEANGSIIGIVSSRDIRQLEESKNLMVDWVMTSPVYCVEANLPLKKALHKMLELKVSCLLVLKSDDTVDGIMTTDDIMWYLASLLSDEKEVPQSFTEMTLQTVGQISQQLANIGI